MERERGAEAALLEQARRALGRSLAAGASVRPIAASLTLEALEVTEPGTTTMIVFFPRAQAEEGRREERVREGLRAAGCALPLVGTFRGGAGGRVLVAESTRSAPPSDPRSGGTLLAGLHAALGGCARLDLAGRQLDPAGAVEVLSRIDDLIRYYPAPAEAQAVLHAPLRRQLELVESFGGLAADGGDAAVVGGYFPEQTVEAQGRRVPLLWGSLRRGWEAEDLVLTAAWSGWLERSAFAAFLAGYFEGGGSLEPSTAQPGVEAAWAVLLCDVRAWYGRFIRGRHELLPLLQRQAAAIALLDNPAVRRTFGELLARASSGG